MHPVVAGTSCTDKDPSRLQAKVGSELIQMDGMLGRVVPSPAHGD